jgi:hypothetical protein
MEGLAEGHSPLKLRAHALDNHIRGEVDMWSS